jgi:conjugal transfer mating pair stabilization protein TraN
MKHLIGILLCFQTPCFAGSLSPLHKEGRALGQSESVCAFKQSKKINAHEFMPSHTPEFDSKEAYEKVLLQAKPSSEAVDFLTHVEVRRNERENKNFHPDEFFLKNSEEITRNTKPMEEEPEEVNFSVHTCRQAGDPFLLTVERTLNVHVVQQKEERVKSCSGHQKIVHIEKKGDFPVSTKSYRLKFEADPSIKSYQIDPIQSLRTHYVARLRWVHVDNTEGCDRCKIKILKKASFQEESEEWSYDNPDLWDLSKNVNSTIVEHLCLDHSPKMINGKTVNRPCWHEKLSFLSQFPKTKECEVLKNKLCEQIDQRCIHTSPFGCALWEFTFKCFDQIKRQYVSLEVQDLEGLNEHQGATTSPPNRSFAEVAARLAVFEEAKHELEKSHTLDASQLEIFKGQRMTCSKNVADHLLYDCCFSYAGLAKQMGLSKCNADEISLAERREEGLCHYVGSYEEKMLGLWKSRDEHAFCCFPSKLARLVQEEGRSQLGLDWGSPKEPNCQGFSFDLLSQINFSKMDLSEMCDQMPQKLPDDFQDKIQAFQDRLQDQIQKEECKLETRDTPL